jgi:hypothetical protein
LTSEEERVLYEREVLNYIENENSDEYIEVDPELLEFYRKKM